MRPSSVADLRLRITITMATSTSSPITAATIPSLLRNDGGNANNWLTVLLVGTKSNRDGIGASLKLTSEGFVQVEQAKGGMSYMSASDPRIHFGLGKRAKIASLEITWPSGQVDRLTNVPIDQIIAVKEGAGNCPAPRFPKNPSRNEFSPPPFSRLVSDGSWQHVARCPDHATVGVEPQPFSSVDSGCLSEVSGAVRRRCPRSRTEHPQRLGRGRQSDTSSKPREAESLSSTMTTTAGSTFI